MTDQVRRVHALRQLESEVGVVIRRVKRVIGERAVAVHPDLQPASYLMLSTLADEGPLRAADVAEMFNVDKGAISRQLAHLVELGLVDRVPDPEDGRATLVSASTEAHRRLLEVAEHRRTLLDEKLGGWSEAELIDFAASLARYNAALS